MAKYMASKIEYFSNEMFSTNYNLFQLKTIGIIISDAYLYLWSMMNGCPNQIEFNQLRWQLAKTHSPRRNAIQGRCSSKVTSFPRYTFSNKEEDNFQKGKIEDISVL
jgi:hypothetical protein